MDGQNIKRLLPSAVEDISMSFNGNLLSVESFEMCPPNFDFAGECLVFPGVPTSPLSQRSIRRLEPTSYRIMAEETDPCPDDNHKRILYLLDLANGLSCHSRMNCNQPDSQTMLKVKRMIDTMLKSVEFVLKADAVTGGGIAELRSISDSP